MKPKQKTITLLIFLALTVSCSMTGFVKLSEFHQSSNTPAANITLVSWNAQKGRDSRFPEDLDLLWEQHRPDIVFLQEARFDLLQGEAMGGYFANSWKYLWPGGATIGVVTLSKLEPIRIQPVPSKYLEFFVTTPKVSLITEYLLPKGKRLLAVNVHLLNFERWGTMKFRSQLDELQSIIANHSGPVFLAGDFNTWNRKRLGLVQNFAENVGLNEVVDFPPGRTTGDLNSSLFNWIFGINKDLPLDRVYHRGLKAQSPRLLSYESSDHKPILVKLAHVNR